MAINFFSISKANARIEELQASVSAKEAELKTAIDNFETLSKECESLKVKLDTLATEAATAKSVLAERDTKIATLQTDLAASQAKQSDFDKKVEVAASNKALEITAKQGLPTPIPTKPTATASSSTAGLTGINKVVSLFEETASKLIAQSPRN